MGVAQTERQLLCQLFDQLGPDVDTLCAGWRTRDLAAHLALRERRLDAAPGILVKPLAGYTRRVQDGFAARPWAELVDLVRSGPPSWSPYAVGSLDELVNTAEFFVHHEDVRRAQPGWEPRPPEPARDAALWRAVSRVGRIAYRNSPVGVVLRRPDGTAEQVKRGPRTVTLTGEPGELLLYSFGRDRVRLDFDGEQPAVAEVQGLSRGF
ncbi:TIGR03085 family metal-binding protein [Gandjariella thermophila]|uniref:TIGR03085 family protein n=1 Tax=Gandjariella thermophila TaxID=1931992 RepID=A0A4D4J736_9PSEU|nr:TIGR03085 family metal-binding protein [Gandjariella thermophila]GDY30498.1 TIGR03085 family protein [Gandjariella thermophila]